MHINCSSGTCKINRDFIFLQVPVDFTVQSPFIHMVVNSKKHSNFHQPFEWRTWDGGTHSNTNTINVLNHSLFRRAQLHHRWIATIEFVTFSGIWNSFRIRHTSRFGDLPPPPLPATTMTSMKLAETQHTRSHCQRVPLHPGLQG